MGFHPFAAPTNPLKNPMGYLLAINPTYTPEDERRKEPTAITHLERKEKSSEPNLQKKLCEPAVNPPDKVKDQAFPVGFVLDAQQSMILNFNFSQTRTRETIFRQQSSSRPTGQSRDLNHLKHLPPGSLT